MGIRSRFCPIGLLTILLCSPALAAPAAQASDPVRDEFVAALQRVRQHVAEPPDSPALQNYIIYDYLLAARLRRDLASTPSEDLDTRVDAFLHAHTGQPVARAL